MIPYWLRRWARWAEWKYLARRIRGYFVRGYRGWADYDTWGLDHYMAGVFAGSLRHLAKNNHGAPHDFIEKYGDKGFDEWDAWLRDKADWFEWYHLDEDGTSDDKGWITPGMPSDEMRRRIDAYTAKMEKFHNEILPDFVKRWGSLWD